MNLPAFKCIKCGFECDVRISFVDHIRNHDPDIIAKKLYDAIEELE